LKLVPKYQSASWNGDLEAYEIDAAGLVSDKPTWVASDLTKLPAAKDRNLYTWDGSTAVKFVHGTGADTMGQANSTTVGSASLTNYIRGDATDEGVGNLYRSRGKKYLGDFVNSPPVYVKGLVDLNYDSIGTGYRDYVALKKARSNAVVFLGGNAGVLHAFHGGTGAELFGYLPRAGLGNLHTIAEKDYGTPSNYHRYFVDGPVTETDAFIKTRRNTTAAAWSNLLVGSMGAGGTGFFALHVDTSNPTTLDANTLLWERSAADDDNIGYIISEIAVGKLKGGGWKAFVGNGVDSKSGAAALLVVDLATGTIDKTLAVDSSGNGLMGVSLLKDKSTQEVVGAYAGDLKGNLWRFDFGSTGLPANWAVGFKGKPLFTAQMGTAQQAITIAPTYLSHSEGPGRVVLFGTGKLLSTDDAKSTTTQSFYGVLDPTADGASAEKDKSPFDAVDDDRQLLQPRTIVTTPVATKDGKSYYAVTGSPVQWGSQYGWMMDLPFSGQRDIYPPVIVAGTYVLVQTMLPAGDAADCEVSSGTGYNYFLTARDGSPLTSPIFDTTGDGIIDEKDTIAAGYSTSADGSDRVLDSDDSGGSGGGGGGGGGGLKCRVGYHAALIEPTNPKGEWACYPNASKTIVDRIWRQIMNPPKAP
jgi:type IV pilus assembly protein PilY1